MAFKLPSRLIEFYPAHLQAGRRFRLFGAMVDVLVWRAYIRRDVKTQVVAAVLLKPEVQETEWIERPRNKLIVAFLFGGGADG